MIDHGEVVQTFHSPLYCCVCNEYEDGHIQQIPFLTDEIRSRYKFEDGLEIKVYPPYNPDARKEQDND